MDVVVAFAASYSGSGEAERLVMLVMSVAMTSLVGEV
jgi:hypothetical protein